MFWTLIGYAALVVLGVCAIAVIGAVLILAKCQLEIDKLDLEEDGYMYLDGTQGVSTES